jgi:hypothetical protein
MNEEALAHCGLSRQEQTYTRTSLLRLVSMTRITSLHYNSHFFLSERSVIFTSRIMGIVIIHII